jgi:hypothetical protein
MLLLHERDIRSQVTRHLDRQVLVKESMRANCRTCSRTDPTNVQCTRGSNHPWSSIARPHPDAVIGAATSGTEPGVIHRGPVVAPTTNIPGVAQSYGGQHLWARGYFCTTEGAVDEQEIQRSLENQQCDADDRDSGSPRPPSPEVALQPQILRMGSSRTPTLVAEQSGGFSCSF